jgi:hypothetical protein
LRRPGRKPVAVPVVICRIQYLPRLGIITMVAHAGGLLKKFVEERCLGKKSVARPPARMMV